MSRLLSHDHVHRKARFTNAGIALGPQEVRLGYHQGPSQEQHEQSPDITTKRWMHGLTHEAMRVRYIDSRRAGWGSLVTVRWSP
jgi:hypothetical protein